MSHALLRARLLRERHRHREAVAALHEHLSRQPDDPDAFVELALNRSAIPGEEPRALEDARRASGLAPQWSFPVSLQARILSSLNRMGEAERAASMALALDPHLVYCWNTRSMIQADLQCWKDSESSARTALELDPGDGTASNLLSLALQKQNRLAESEEESLRRLESDPESAYPFYNLGQGALRRKRYGEAETYFRDALKCNPEQSYVREALKFSILQRSIFYRVLAATLSVSRRFLARKINLCVVLAVLLGRALYSLAREFDPEDSIVIGLFLYLVIFSSWLMRPLSNLILMRRKTSREMVDAAQRREAWVIAAGFWSGVLLFSAGLMMRSGALIAPGLGAMLGCVPWSLVFTNESPRGRLIFAGLGLAINATGIWIGLCVSIFPPAGWVARGYSMAILFGLTSLVAAVLLTANSRLVRPAAAA